MTSNNPQRQRIAHNLMLAKTAQWLRQRGYQVAVIPPLHGQDGSILYSLPNQPAYLAGVGTTLVWDGQNITVETKDKPHGGPKGNPKAGKAATP